MNMNEKRRQVNPLKIMVLSAALLAFGAQSSVPRAHESARSPQVRPGCMQTAGSTRKKEQLENGIRNQVRFLGEPEHLVSIRERMAQLKIPALSLALIEHGHLAWAETYRNARFPREQHLDCDGIFQAASLSKPVTFLAAVRMASAGKIDLDRNIQRYLKSYTLPQGKQTADHPVTFRNLFAHTSGITPGGYEGYARGQPVPSLPEILKGAPGVNSPAVAVLHTPGRVLAYSGGGYTLAELALEDIYGDTFPDIMKKWVLDPVGMTHSDFAQPLPASKARDAANGYTRTGRMLPGGWHTYPEQSAAGLWSNSVDLARFMVEIYKAYHGNSKVFSQSAVRAFLGQERDRSAYGFIVDRADDSISITHYGGNAGYRTGMTINLTTGNGLVYLTDSDNGVPLGNELMLSASRVYGWRHFKQTEVHRRQVDAALLKGLAGRYRWNGIIDLSVGFDDQGKHLSLRFPNGDAYRLVPITGDGLDLINPNSGIRVTFLKASGYHTFRLYGQEAVKLDKATPHGSLLITTDALARHLHDPDLVLLHVGDAKAYKAAHIPGARLVRLSDVAAHNSKLALEMPAAQALRKRLSALGIGAHSHIVVYFGTDWVSPATRIMFTLQAAGLGPRARLLDGGMPKWRREGHPVTGQATAAPAPGNLGPLHVHAPIVDAAFVQAHVRQPGYALLDARTPDYYIGSRQSGARGHLRRGHIPGARNLPFTRVFNDDLTFKSKARLLALFRRAGVKPGDRVIVYCHIGQQATAVTFAARLAGIHAQLYDGSFQDWTIRDLPVAK